ALTIGELRSSEAAAGEASSANIMKARPQRGWQPSRRGHSSGMRDSSDPGASSESSRTAVIAGPLPTERHNHAGPLLMERPVNLVISPRGGTDAAAIQSAGSARLRADCC